MMLYNGNTPVTQSIIFFQKIPNNVKGWIYGNRCKQCSNILWAKAFSWKESNLPNLAYKVTGALYVLWWFAHKEF